MWTTTVSYSTSVCRSSSPTAKSGLSSGASSALKRLSLTRQYIAIQLRNPTNFSASTIIISALGYYGKAALIERVLCAHFSTFKADHENWGTRLLRSFGNSYNTPYGVTSYAQNILSLHIKVHHVGSRPVWLNETSFSQESFTCARPEDAIACEESPQYYRLNEAFGQTDRQFEPSSSPFPSATETTQPE